MIIFQVKSLTVYCAIVQLKAVSCDVTFPATGVDKTDHLTIGITETLHMPDL